MSHYVVVAETGADIPASVAEELGIYLVPMHVNLGDETYDDASFPAKRVFDYYDQTGTLPKTSGCTPADFDKAFQNIFAKDPDAKIIYPAYSAITTCSFQSARSVSAAYPPMIMEDTKHVTAGQYLVVTEVARFVKDHPEATEEQVAELMNDTIRKTRMSFIPGGLEYLHAGGRLSNAAFLGASLLKIKPTIEIIDGKLTATKKRRGAMEKCVKSLTEDFLASEKWDKRRICALRSAGLSQEIQDAVTARLKEEGFENVIWVDTGCVISSHCGPGSFGLAAITE